MKKILVVLSEWGYWGEELVGPLEVLDAHGYESTFMTPKGKRAHALPPSMTAGYLDPPLDKCVTDEHFAAKTREIDASTRLDNPVNLSTWFPAAPVLQRGRTSATRWRPTTRRATRRGRN